MGEKLRKNRPVNERIQTQFSRIAKRLGIGFISAIFTGIISGLLLRLIMKIMAFVFPHMATGFTLEGTAMLVVLGIGFTLANSIIYMSIFRFLPQRWINKGFIYGCLNLIFYGIPLFLSNPDNDLFGPQAPLGITLFSLLFLLGGLLLAWSVNLLINWVEQSNGRLKYTYFFFFIFIVPAIVMSFEIIQDIFTGIIPAIRSNF